MKTLTAVLLAALALSTRAATNTRSRMIEGAPVNVKDYGAVGDGVADDTAAIQAAINAAQAATDPAVYGSDTPALGPVRVFFLAGYYKITSALVVSRKVALEGEGQSEFSSGARLIQMTNGQDLIRVTPAQAQGMSFSMERLTLRDGTGGGAGHLLHITAGVSAVNSIRIYDCTFGTPETYAIRIEKGDDVKIARNLFDVSNGYAISLGTTTAANAVSNAAITDNAFYNIPLKVLTIYNVDGLLFSGNRIYSQAGHSTGQLVEAYLSLPYQVKDLQIEHNALKSVASFGTFSAVAGLTIHGNRGTSCGGGAGAALSMIQMYGTSTDVVVEDNRIVGNWDTKRFYDDSGGTVTGRIVNNAVRATAGTAQAIYAPNFTGHLRDNYLPGWGAVSVSEVITTTGNAVSPGVVASLAAVSATFTVAGARQADIVVVGPSSTAWFAPVGIEVEAFVSAANTITVSYRNVTGDAIGVPAHDITYRVER